MEIGNSSNIVLGRKLLLPHKETAITYDCSIQKRSNRITHDQKP